MEARLASARYRSVSIRPALSGWVLAGVPVAFETQVRASRKPGHAPGENLNPPAADR
jgi:hypothetical protein